MLGGGTYYYAPEYGDHTVGRYTLERVRYAAKMYRVTGKPMLAAGGAPLGNRSSEAMQMKAVLEEDPDHTEARRRVRALTGEDPPSRLP